MTGVPKVRNSSSRGGRRRAHNALKFNNLALCADCGAKKLPHHVCPECGRYNDRPIQEPKMEKSE